MSLRGSGGWAAGVALAAVVSVAVATPAAADFGVRFDGEVVNREQNGVAVAATQAGSHPDEVTATIDFNQHADPELGLLVPDEDVRDIRVDLPPGFVGNPLAVQRCTENALESRRSGTDCPADSQVGVVTIITTSLLPVTLPVFNMVPQDDVPGAFGFSVGQFVPVHLSASVRSGSDYGLTITIPRISQAAPILRTSLTFWGVPADPSHDADRGTVYNGSEWEICANSANPDCRNASDQPPQAFLTNPTVCNGPLETTLNATSWFGSVASASFFTHQPAPDEATLVGPDGCDLVPFDASLTARPTTPRAGAPSGFAFDLDIPQNDAPGGIAQGHLRKAVVRLPVGVSISPPSAGGLGSCSDAQASLGTTAEPACAGSSKIGTVTIDTPLLRERMTGSIHLRDPLPGNLFRLLLVARGPGVLVKLPGTVAPDPVTGQITATFDNNPQLPFSKLHLDFKDGPRAPLSLPSTCGRYTTVAELTSWSGKTVSSSSSFEVTRDGAGTPCPPRSFTPDFSAGLLNPVAGTSSLFTLTFARDDEDPTLRSIALDMPKGLLGRIADADLCAPAQAALGACGESSRIGSTKTGAGGGPTPFFLPGRVYLTGPYRGAPFGLSIVVPAIAGPFDLGTVVVRAAIFVDRTTATLRIVSDPLPTILEGVPLLIRTVTVDVDRPRFMVAPTNCQPMRVGGVIESNEASAASVGTRFQVGDCAALRYRPRMTLKVGARGKLTRGRRTPLDVTLQMTPGQANNRSVTVTLPKTINARLDVVNRRRACTFEQFRADRCPQMVGTASAVTPLLRDPLRGPAYFVYNPDRRLPDLVVRLKGQVAFDLVGKVAITRDLRLRTSFDTVPDVPITSFRLVLASGARNGPVGLTANVCQRDVRRQLRADLALTAQSNRKIARQQSIAVVGCGRAQRRSAPSRPGRTSR